MQLSYTKLVERTCRYSDLSNLDKENFDTFDPDVFPDVPLPDSNLTQREHMLKMKSVLWDYQEEFPDNPERTFSLSEKPALEKHFC